MLMLVLPETLAVADQYFLALGDSFGPFPAAACRQDEDTDALLILQVPDIDPAISKLCVGSSRADASVIIDEAGFIAGMRGINTDAAVTIKRIVIVGSNVCIFWAMSEAKIVQYERACWQMSCCKQTVLSTSRMFGVIDGSDSYQCARRWRGFLAGHMTRWLFGADDI